MTKLLSRMLAFSALSTAFLGFSAFGAADMTRSTYTMFGSQTYLMDQDVLDGFPEPIQLVRTRDTMGDHQIIFNILRHERVCVDEQQVCVSHDAHGHCTGYETECVQWEDRTTPVQKQVELNFTALPQFPKDQEETYQLTITRTSPGGDGEDMVMTSFDAGSTVTPVKILRWSDFRYDISPKQ